MKGYNKTPWDAFQQDAVAKYVRTVLEKFPMVTYNVKTPYVPENGVAARTIHSFR